jgi:hypothetical protein
MGIGIVWLSGESVLLMGCTLFWYAIACRDSNTVLLFIDCCEKGSGERDDTSLGRQTFFAGVWGEG